MNSRPSPYRKGEPLPSLQLSDQHQFILLDCITLAGAASPSGTNLLDGVFDILDDKLSFLASGMLNEYTDRLPYTLQLNKEFEGNV